MNFEKWLRLILLLVIVFGILKCISIHPLPQQNTNQTKEDKSKIKIKDEKCTYTKENARKDIKDDKIKAVEQITKCNANCLGSDNATLGATGDKNCKSCTDLLPVMDPMYNMREMCKQIILLEDHLFQKEKRCHDCICKHFLTIEALAEEAITLDKSHKYPELEDMPTKVRKITKKYINNHKDHSQHAITGQDLRELRKGLMQKCFNNF
jgi:hypothetical protein